MSLRLPLHPRPLALRHPRTGETLVPLGHLPNGRPVWPIMGASPDGDGDDDGDDDGDKDTEADRIARIAAREKAQGKRAGVREVMETLGFATVEEAQAFITRQREAEAAAETEAQRKLREATERENAAIARERAAADKAFRADLRAALIERGCARADLDDAQVLLERAVTRDADATEEELAEAITEAADSLAERRKELFGGTATEEPPAKKKVAAPAPGKPKSANQPPAATYGAKGIEEAQRRFARRNGGAGSITGANA